MNQAMKRKIAMLLMASMLVPSTAFASDSSPVVTSDNTNTATTTSAVLGSDVAGHWAEQDFATWFNKHLLNGYADGSFKPNQAITRAEFVVLLDRVFNFVDKSSVSFTDLKATDYSYEAFEKAVAAGIIQGYSDGSVHPNSPISRKEAAVMLYRSFELAASSASTSLSDVASLPAWAKEAVETLVNDGYVNGYPDGTFGGDKSITRAEAIRMMNNLSGEIVNAAGTYSDLTTCNMVISKPGVVLEDTVIEGDLYLTAGVGEGDVDLNRVTVKGQVHINGGGVNSIKLNDSTIQTIIIDKKNGQIRVVTKGDTTVQQTFVISGAKLVEENDADGKGFASIILDESLSAGATVQLDGHFDQVDVRALTTPELQLLAGIINNLNLQQQAVLNVDEKGEVKEVVIKVDGSIQVKGTGKVTASDPKAAGQLVFVNGTGGTGSTGNTGNTNGNGSGTVTLPVAVADLVLDQQEDFGMFVGDSESLTAAISPTNATNKNLQWSSSDEEVATVDAQGKVTAIAAGTAVITVTSVSNSAKTDSVTITVTRAVDQVIVHEDDFGLFIDEEKNLTASYTPSNATNPTLQWASSNEEVATVDAQGKVTAVAPGTAVITASSVSNPTKSDSVTVTVSRAVNQVAVNEDDFSLLIGAKKSLTTSVLPADATNQTLRWLSSNEEVATVDAYGKVTAVAAGTAVITASSISNPTKLDTVTVTVSKAVFTNVSVHDPSITVDKDTGEFYVFGSHIDAAKSNDLMNWTRFTNGYTTPNNVLFGNLSSNLHGSFAWAGENDADSKGGFSVWAPFTFYNKDYVNEDGSKGAYVMYYCTSATYIRSAIGYAVSQNIEGPYKYVDTIMYSGFTKDSAVDTNSTVDKKWTNTNIQTLVDNGTLQGARTGWFNSSGGFNNSLFPNAIDPALYYDTDGKLWMVYGSWSGGIFALEIDKSTGEAIYPGADGTTSDGRMIDRYFGTKIAGGYGKSGEGPFVVYDKSTGYYFLNVTYGGLASDGGYNMRMYRSTSPTGPFVDAKGQNAVLPSSSAVLDDYGNKMMGNYLFERLTGDPGTGNGIGYMSPGHNSVYIDEETGQYFLIFHARFPNQGEGHEVRVHQMFLNEDKWPIVSPYRYAGEKLDQVAEQDLVGEYKFINHGKATTKDLTVSSFIQLNADHTVTGDAQGSWSLMGDNQAAITVGGKTYKGVFVREWDGTSERVVVTFTAMSGEGITIWGSKLENETEQQVVNDVLNGINLGDLNNVIADLKLPLVGTRHSSIAWQTSDASIISAAGVVTRPEWDETAGVAQLTATVTKGSTTASKTFTLNVTPRVKASLTANYNFEGDLTDATGAYAAGTITGDRVNNTGGTITYVAGKTSGTAAKFDGSSGIRLPDGLIQGNSYSVSLWLKPDQAVSSWTTAFFGGRDGNNWISLLPQGWGGTFLWAHDETNGGMYYDWQSGLTIASGQWSHLAITVENGVATLYVNGVAKVSKSGVPDVFTTNNGIFGLGVNFWDLPFKGLMDDLRIYEGVLSPNEIRSMVFDTAVKVDAINLGITEKRVSVGGTFAPRGVSVSPSSAGNQVLTWTSSSPTVATVDASGRVTGLTAGTTTITATSTDGSNKSASYTLYVMDGAIAYYKFEGDLLDSTGHGAGTITGNSAANTGGTITYDTGVSGGQASVFNGASGIRLPNGLISGNSYSVSMSIYVEQGTQYTPAFFGANTTESWISLVPRGPGDAQPTELWSGTNWYDAATGIQIPTGHWATVTFTVNNGAVVVYVDGVAKYTGTNFPDVFKSDNAVFALGVNYGWDAPFKGKIDELRIFDRSLSASEVQALQPAAATTTPEAQLEETPVEVTPEISAE